VAASRNERRRRQGTPEIENARRAASSRSLVLLSSLPLPSLFVFIARRPRRVSAMQMQNADPLGADPLAASPSARSVPAERPDVGRSN